MTIFVVINSEERGYWFYDTIIGAYSKKALAVRARANYALSNDTIDDSEYADLLTNKRQVWCYERGTIMVKKLMIDNAWLEMEKTK